MLAVAALGFVLTGCKKEEAAETGGDAATTAAPAATAGEPK